MARAKGDGTIYEYEPGKFRGFVEVGYKDGKRIRKSAYGKTKSEVVKKLNALKGQASRGKLVANNTQTLNAFIEKRWLPYKLTSVKPSTYQSYLYIWNSHIKDTIGNMNIQKIETSHVNDYFKSRGKYGLSGCSIAKHRAMLSNVFKMVLSEKLVYSNPITEANQISIVSPEIHALEEEDAKAFLEEARQYSIAHKDENQLHKLYYIILLALTSGMRRGELLALRWKYVDEDKSTITIAESVVQLNQGCIIGTPKSANSRRTIAVDRGVIEELKELKDSTTTPEDFVFASLDGNMMIPSNVYKTFDNFREKSKYTCRFHDLRHTHATTLIIHGVDIKTVSMRLGHSDIQTTLNKYTHFIPAVDQKAASLVANLFKK